MMTCECVLQNNGGQQEFMLTGHAFVNRHVDRLLTKIGFADVISACCLAAAKHRNDKHALSFTKHDSSRQQVAARLLTT